MLTINLLQALPKTPLWERLDAAGRLTVERTRESNVDFRSALWRSARQLAALHSPCLQPGRDLSAISLEFARHLSNRMSPPLSRARLNPANLRRG